MVYEFKKGAVVPSGTTVEETERGLEEVEQRHGKVTVGTITDDVEADPERHLLRVWFEWDPELCVRKYHEIQAGHIVRSVAVKELAPGHEAPVRAWVITHNDNGEQVYQRTQYVLQSSDRREELIQQIRRDKKAIDDKLEELLTLISLVGKVAAA